jgi:hypothetical protein
MPVDRQPTDRTNRTIGLRVYTYIWESPRPARLGRDWKCERDDIVSCSTSRRRWYEATVTPAGLLSPKNSGWCRNEGGTLRAASIVNMPSRSDIKKSLAPMQARTASISSRIAHADSGCLASSQKNHVSVCADVSCPAKRSVLQGVRTEIDYILPTYPI